jgi:hypothetical protein
MDLRRVALVALVGSVLGAIMPIWNAVYRLVGFGVTGFNWWVLPSMAVMLLFIALMPVFYFALYRDRGTMRFPRYLRKVAVAAAVSCALVTALRVLAHGSSDVDHRVWPVEQRDLYSTVARHVPRYARDPV